jgi:hypothetical protein
LEVVFVDIQCLYCSLQVYFLVRLLRSNLNTRF